MENEELGLFTELTQKSLGSKWISWAQLETEQGCHLKKEMASTCNSEPTNRPKTDKWKSGLHLKGPRFEARTSAL